MDIPITKQNILNLIKGSALTEEEILRALCASPDKRHKARVRKLMKTLKRTGLAINEPSREKGGLTYKAVSDTLSAVRKDR